MKNDVLFDMLTREQFRQNQGINLIASENYAPSQVREMVGSILMNKYVEGLAGARYYSGCENVDAIEVETINRFKDLFKAEHVNVQPHSGSQANLAVYFALLQPGDTILSMKLSDGGHLSHGLKVNLSGALYNIVYYGVHEHSELINYEQIESLALQYKPKLIIAGASSYSRIIDFKRVAQIAQSVGAYFMADIAHIAGLVAAGVHPSPIECADIVTMTTHKTFRGPRGGVILCKKNIASKIDKAVMPGIQGGAFAHEIAAKGVACLLAQRHEFKLYQKHVLMCAQVMAERFIQLGYKVVSGGTDTHLFLIDVQPIGFTGKQVEFILEQVGIFVNRNVIPFDNLSPMYGGGIRVGSAAIETRGATLADCVKIVDIIDMVLQEYVAKKTISLESVEKYKKMAQLITSTWS